MTVRTTMLVWNLLVCCGSSCGYAHDFWLQPDQFWLDPNAAGTLTLEVGHGRFRQRSPIPARRIVRFEATGAAGVAIDLRSHLELGQPSKDGDFQLRSTGTYILVFQTDSQAQTHLPALRFNDYLEVEGLTAASEQRARLHQQDKDGSERYSRCAKALLQIGPADARSITHLSEPVGLTLEIVPEVNPYAIPKSHNLPVHVLYAGQTLQGALVKMTDLANDASPVEEHRTDQSGRATFNMPTSGKWLLNVIWTRVLPDTEETDFETVFSSLSFGFPPGLL